MAVMPREVVVNVKAKIDPALLPDEAADDTLADVLAEYVHRRHGIEGRPEPEWFRQFLADRGYRLLLAPEE